MSLTTFKLLKVLVYNKGFFVLWSLWSKLTSNFNTSDWRMSYRCHYVFINIRKSVQDFIFMSIFNFLQQSFSCTLSHRIHSTHSSNPFTSVHSKFCAFPHLSLSFVSHTAARATHVCCTVLKQQHHSTQVLNRRVTRTLVHAATRYSKLNVIACMWCVKRSNVGGGSASARRKVLIWWKSGQNPWKYGQYLWKPSQNPWKSGQKWHPT